MISALTLAGVASQSASGIQFGSSLITGGLYLRCNRLSRRRQGFSSSNIRCELSRPLNGYCFPTLNHDLVLDDEVEILNSCPAADQALSLLD